MKIFLPILQAKPKGLMYDSNHSKVMYDLGLVMADNIDLVVENVRIDSKDIFIEQALVIKIDNRNKDVTRITTHNGAILLVDMGIKEYIEYTNTIQEEQIKQHDKVNGIHNIIEN